MKSLKINIPEGYEIDKEKSTFEEIVFKPKVLKWIDNEDAYIKGYYIGFDSSIGELAFSNKFRNVKTNFNIFATEKQAKSALAMARISQIMANDERFGGVITDEEWANQYMSKFILSRSFDKIEETCYNWTYSFLAFHTEEQRKLFLEENEDLIKDYLML